MLSGQPVSAVGDGAGSADRGCGWVFSNSAATDTCNLRVGSEVHPCTAEPEMRIRAHFPLVPLPHYKKTLQPPPRPAEPAPSPTASIPAESSEHNIQTPSIVLVPLIYCS